MDTKTLYLHIGYPKTATTSLQDSFFSQLNDIEYIGKPYQKEWHKNLHDIIFKNSKINFLFFHRYFYFIKVIASHAFPNKNMSNIQKFKHFSFSFIEIYFDSLKQIKDPVQKKFKRLQVL